MAPIKFEENIREKLQERELKPSEGAWDRLASQLGTTEEPKKPFYLWMAVAASFVGVLLIGSWLLLNGDADRTELVEEDSKEIQNTIDEEKTNETFQPVPQFEEQELSVGEDDNPEKPQVNEVARTPNETLDNREQEKRAAPVVVAKTETDVMENVKEQLILQEPKVEEGMALQEVEQEQGSGISPQQEGDAYIQEKVDQVIQQVKDLQQKNSTVSAAEIDALLAKAQRDIATKRILDSDHQKVDARALLMDVEVELERSFRDKVFEALGEGFNKVRTAVAERNN